MIILEEASSKGMKDKGGYWTFAMHMSWVANCVLVWLILVLHFYNFARVLKIQIFKVSNIKWLNSLREKNKFYSSINIPEFLNLIGFRKFFEK